jgi:hypothetical protein
MGRFEYRLRIDRYAAGIGQGCASCAVLVIQPNLSSETMLNHAPRYNWLSTGGLLKSSVLGRSAGRKPLAGRASETPDHEADEAVPSQATKEHAQESSMRFNRVMTSAWARQ